MMANDAMNKRVLLVALFFAILCTSTFGVLTQTPSMTQSASVTNDSTGKLDSKMLPDIEYNISFYNLAYNLYDLEYLNGGIWGTNPDDYRIHEVVLNTGHLIAQIFVGFRSAGLASDGTFSTYLSIPSI